MGKSPRRDSTPVVLLARDMPSAAVSRPREGPAQRSSSSRRRSTPRASWPIIEWMRGRRFKSYIAAFVDAESVTHRYAFMARSRRRAERQAREMGTHWRYTLVGVELDRRGEARRRPLLVLAGYTLAVAGIAITAMTAFALSLGGAL